MTAVYTSASHQCRWGLITQPRRDGRSSRSLVWICEYPYRTIRTAPSDDCESCRAAVAEAESARRPHLDDGVLALERLMTATTD